MKAPVPTSPKPKGLQADSSQAGLQMEAGWWEAAFSIQIIMGMILFRGGGESIRLSKSQPNWAQTSVPIGES